MNANLSRRAFVTGAATAILPLAGFSRPTGGLAQIGGSTPYLVSSDWLAGEIERNAAELLVIDLGDLRDYRSGHIPGAIHSFWLETIERDYEFYGTVLNQKDIGSDVDGQGKRIDWLKRHGIGPQTHVIACDHTDARRAARIAWFLRFLGHERASVLNGGLNEWNEAGYALSSHNEPPSVHDDTPQVLPSEGFWVSTERLEELLDSREITLVDIRTDQERLNTVDGQFETGVIPDSIRVPWTTPAFDLSGATGAFDPVSAAEAFAGFGIDPAERIVIYGRFGSDANQIWIALRASGFERVEIYDRGWVGWIGTGRMSLPIS